MTKFNIGDKVRILDVDMIYLGFKYWNNGDITEVVDFLAGDPCLKSTIGCGNLQIHRDEMRYVELVPSRKDRLTEAEAKIATLEAEVKALKARLLGAHIGRMGADIGESMMYLAKVANQTPNQRRADVIKRAQAFVADWESKCNRKISYVVNAEKRTVVALKHRNYFGIDAGVFDRGIAKCDPNDVFNADIGKAIALGRALGVKVPKEFTDAVKPTEYAVGQIITFPKADDWYRKVNYRVVSFSNGFGDLTVIYDEFDNDVGKKGYLMPDGRKLSIIDDTDAVYE